MHSPEDRLSFSGVVLAGGKSRRMGFPKALIRTANPSEPGSPPATIPLLARQLHILREAGISEVMVSVQPHTVQSWQLHPANELASPPVELLGQLSSVSDPRIRIVRDQFEDAGPLAGISAALESCTGSHLVVVALDLGRIQPDLIRWMIGKATMGTGVVADLEGQMQPLCSVIPVGLGARVRERVSADRLSVRQWFEELICEKRMMSATIPEPWKYQLGNWNTPADLPDGTREETQKKAAP